MIPASEVATQLKKAVAGQVSVELLDKSHTWDEVYAGDVWFQIGDWQIAFFNDCDELDYTSIAKAPDGSNAEFSDWCTEEGITCPLDLLSTEERNELERLLAAA